MDMPENSEELHFLVEDASGETHLTAEQIYALTKRGREVVAEMEDDGVVVVKVIHDPDKGIFVEAVRANSAEIHLFAAGNEDNWRYKVIRFVLAVIASGSVHGIKWPEPGKDLLLFTQVLNDVFDSMDLQVTEQDGQAPEAIRPPLPTRH